MNRLVGFNFNCSIVVYISSYFFTLFKVASGRYLFRGNVLAHNSTQPYSLYFLKGNDQRLLSRNQAEEINQIILENNLQTSCLVYNENEAVRKLAAWKSALPWIKPHYAIKSNPALPILNDLHGNGAGFDCASRNELEAVMSVGANKNQIVYSNPIKDESDLMWAEQNGVKYTTADSIDELIKIKELAPNMQVLWRIAIKEEATDNLATPFSGKFGDDIDTDEKIHSRMHEIQEMGFKLKGIHFHCGSGQHGSSAFGKAVALARRCLEIGRAYGHEMTLMDIGGGFPSGQLSQKTIQALKPTRNDPLGYRVIAEPGRHLSGNSFYLLTRVLGKRTKNNKPCYHLNESLYHSFNCNLMDGVSFQNHSSQFYMGLDKEGNFPINNVQNSTLFGMTCDGLDIIASSIGVPTSLKVSDWLCIGGMGAYTYGCRSNFNGMKSTERVIRWPKVEEAEPAVQGQFELAF